MAQKLDHEQPDQEPDTIRELKELAPELKELASGMWQYPTDEERCCIYRVQYNLRRVNPEAYTPQLLLIGPLHHSSKSQVFKSPGDITNTKVMGYLNMEEHKKIYLSEFVGKFEGETTIDQLRRVIKEEEGNIRASYSESTAWIKSPEFIEMILLDSVFILEFLLRSADYYQTLRSGPVKTGDLIQDLPCLRNLVNHDLMLLENQLPYFILEKLFDLVVPILYPNLTLRELVIIIIGFHGKIRDDSTFRHFTDLYRLVRVETLGSEKPTVAFLISSAFEYHSKDTIPTPTKTKFRNFTDHLFRRRSREPAAEFKYKIIKHMYNAEKLYSAGMKFEAVKDELSIDVRFENGCLKIPSLWVYDEMEIILRNIMALEQCLYPVNAYVCDYVTFLDFLIDTDKDVDLLIEKGIINNWIGKQSSVAEMVNKLCLGISSSWASYYYDIALEVNGYYENPVNRSRAVLGRMYFSNLWTGTATVAATLLLVMTLIQTVCSIIQVMQK